MTIGTGTKTSAMTRRLVTVLVAAAAIAAASPAAASAFVFLAFTTGPGPTARVDAFDFELEASLHIELLRGGAAIGSSSTGTLEVAELRAGDTVRLSPDGGTTVIATVTYDGTPALGEICLGSSSFTVTRPPGDRTLEAGASVLSENEDSLPIESTMSADSPAVVTLARPLALGDTAFAQSVAATDDMLVGTAHTVEAKTCTTGEQPDGTRDQNPDATRRGREAADRAVGGRCRRGSSGSVSRVWDAAAASRCRSRSPSPARCGSSSSRAARSSAPARRPPRAATGA